MRILWKRWEQPRKATFVAAASVEEEAKEADARRGANRTVFVFVGK